MKPALAGVLAAIVLVTSVAWKKPGCCKHCGCSCTPEKVCRVVVETKKVPKTCYGAECEDICVPGPSCLCGEHCECRPDPCNPGCTISKTVKDWEPGCAYVKTRTKLTKREVEVEQKTYRWVVEYLCPRCADCARKGLPLPGNERGLAAADAGAKPVQPAGYAEIGGREPLQNPAVTVRR